MKPIKPQLRWLLRLFFKRSLGMEMIGKLSGCRLNLIIISMNIWFEVKRDFGSTESSDYRVGQRTIHTSSRLHKTICAHGGLSKASPTFVE